MPYLPPDPGTTPVRFIDGPGYAPPTAGTGPISIGSAGVDVARLQLATGGISPSHAAGTRARSSLDVHRSGGTHAKGWSTLAWTPEPRSNGSVIVGWRPRPHRIGHVDVAPGGPRPRVTGQHVDAPPHQPRYGGGPDLRWTHLNRRSGRCVHKTLATGRFHVPVEVPWGILGRATLSSSHVWRGGLRRRGGSAPDISPAYLLAWGLPPPETSGPESQPPYYTPPEAGGGRVNFACAFMTLAPGAGPIIFPAPCLPFGLASIPIRRVYRVTTTANLIRVSDGAEVPCDAMSVTFDADSWAYEASATITSRAALDLVRPSGGVPVVVESQAEGVSSWRWIVEDWRWERVHGGQRWRISGRSLSAWLAAPYERPSEATSDADRLVSQLADAELPPSGWALTWDAPDWLVPAGAWSYQGRAPIQAIARLAAAAGGIVVPDLAAQGLTVKPRYAVAPWNYAAGTPDVTVPAAACLAQTRRNTPATGANAVYVYGGQVGGILARGRLTGTAGDLLAQDHQDALTTHTTGARALAERLLAAAQPQPELAAFTVPLGGDFPLVALGTLVSVTEGAEDIRGVVSAVTVEIARGGPRRALEPVQTVRLGEDTANPYRALTQLIPGSALLHAVVIATHADQTVTVALASGATLRVRYSGVVSPQVEDTVWVLDDVVEGKAPDLPAYDLELF